ncbi:Immunity protein 52 [Duganella sp. CF458]|uniref:immunity 52 family protein n=1 Tax=Duganella sp. CF458 TaxID=1884368 RepID=UPI0008EC7187|nr:immunity 52 family protein [Duganella sp. CF458]SFF64302.1 Immunity protein 52 [Duganella sp. CF458]
MKSPPAMELSFRRGQPKLIDVETQLNELYEFSRVVAPYSELLERWWLSSSSSKADAQMYEAFDANGPTTAALAVLSQKNLGVHDLRSISLWNGAEKDAESAGLSSRVNILGRPDTVEFSLRLKPEVADWRVPASWLTKAVSIWQPSVCTFGPFWYSDHKVFEDRPGVSWMLYLPQTLAQQQVPEARALVPVVGKDEKGKDKQIGTIVVSVIDEPFSDENLEHVKIANAIEVRLVDQDLLPRYADL